MVCAQISNQVKPLLHGYEEIQIVEESPGLQESLSDIADEIEDDVEEKDSAQKSLDFF